MNIKQTNKNQQNSIITIGKASQNTFGSIPRPVFESYRSQGWYTVGKISKITLGSDGRTTEGFIRRRWIS